MFDEFAKSIKALGFQVFLSPDKSHGFFTNCDGSRVISFGSNGTLSALSGNYGPPSYESGTGWALAENIWDLKTKGDVENILQAVPPKWCGNGWKYFTTKEQYLKAYQQSSKYREV